jgi:hypothetical protein
MAEASGSRRGGAPANVNGGSEGARVAVASGSRRGGAPNVGEAAV